MRSNIFQLAVVIAICIAWGAASQAQPDMPETNPPPVEAEQPDTAQPDMPHPAEVSPPNPGSPGEPNQAINPSALSVSPLVVGFRRGEPLGSYDTGIFCWKAGDYAWDLTENKGRITKVMDARLRQRLADEGFTLAQDPTDIFGEMKDDSKFIVGGIITKIRMKVCYPKIGFGDVTRSSGAASLSITWKIFSKDEKKVVATIEASTDNDVSKGITGEEYSILLGAFDKALDQLMSTPEFAAAAAAR